MADPVRWGILGAAKFARQHMGPAIHMARGGALTSLATSSPERATPFAEMVPGLRVFESYEALLADPGIDVVYVPLPNHLHVQWALKALAAGKHVLVEKPLAMTAGEFDAVIAARDGSGLMAAEAYMIVHHPQWMKARELVRSGEIGDLVMVDTVFSYDNSGDSGNIRNKPGTGGGGIPDIGVYTYGSVRFVTGQEPEEILRADITWENGVDTFAHVTARFPGFHYSAVTSMRAHPRQHVTFHGRDGVLTLTAPFNAGVFGEAQVHLHKAGQESVCWRFPGVNQYVLQVEAFNRAAASGAHGDYPCPLEFSRGTQAMIDRVFAAARG